LQFAEIERRTWKRERKGQKRTKKNKIYIKKIWEKEKESEKKYKKGETRKGYKGRWKIREKKEERKKKKEEREEKWNVL